MLTPKRKTNQKAAESLFSSSATPTVNVESLNIYFCTMTTEQPHIWAQRDLLFFGCFFFLNTLSVALVLQTQLGLTQPSLIIVFLFCRTCCATGATLWSSSLLLLSPSSWDPQGDGQLGVLQRPKGREMSHHKGTLKISSQALWETKSSELFIYLFFSFQLAYN